MRRVRTTAPQRLRRATGAASAALVLAVALVVAGCTTGGSDQTDQAATPRTSSAPAAAPTTTAPATSGSLAEASPSAPAQPPVAKVQRDGGTAATVGAEVSAPNAPVVYADGVTLRITDVSYATEASQGPGASTGREFARLTVELTNGSTAPIDVSTSVVTVLDAGGARLVPVYTPESGARDFSGSVDPGLATTAVYAVAAPADHSAPLTIVVDFDAVHASAVFRGALT